MRHKEMIHDIDVIHYLCLGKGCGYKAKTGGNLMNLIASKHKKRFKKC